MSSPTLAEVTMGTLKLFFDRYPDMTDTRKQSLFEDTERYQVRAMLVGGHYFFTTHVILVQHGGAGQRVYYDPDTMEIAGEEVVGEGRVSPHPIIEWLSIRRRAVEQWRVAGIGGVFRRWALAHGKAFAVDFEMLVKART